MPDLNDVYRNVLTARPPAYTDHMMGWIAHFIQPFRLTEITIWLDPSFISFDTTVIIEARNLPGLQFRHKFKSRDFLDHPDSIAYTVAKTYGEWLRSIYIPPGELIELGEN